MKKRHGLTLTMTAARRRAGLTQGELAKLMCTERSVVTRWETGNDVPNVTTLRKMAEVTGHRLDVRLLPYSGRKSNRGYPAMDIKPSSLTDAEQFRLDVIEALSAIDAEIDALQESIEEGEVVTSTRLKELRAASRQRIGRFRDYHSQKIGPI